MDDVAAPHAPGELEFVRAFVNTLDIEDDVDRLRDATAWAVWAAEMQLDTGDREPSRAALASARGLRESLRDALEANHDRVPLPPSTADALTAAARRAHVVPLFTPSGLGLSGASVGLDAVTARVLDAVAAALADGTFSRLKACTNDTCRWAFYDHSRSRTGQWCSMAVCGNRAKQSRHRRTRARTEAGAT
ncbi:CGNR zinc finger domain-containing protein [Herbiconiux sp. A18JL235]|uniref:CGNR zinc finger domain-containing protein n=1 Tax=Herbiconiux sp. A18JL235 TaxID=3152363 RepID=A0AB39BG59_9MICO